MTNKDSNYLISRLKETILSGLKIIIDLRKGKRERIKFYLWRDRIRLRIAREFRFAQITRKPITKIRPTDGNMSKVFLSGY